MLNLGFVGFGRMGITHFAILKAHPSVRVTGVVEQSGAMRMMLDRYFGVSTFGDLDEMAEKVEVDAVVVCTPNDSHGEIIEKALQRGWHVFAEKPLVTEIDAGERVLGFLEQRPVVNQVGYVNRFNEVFQSVKELLDGGVLGELVTLRSEMYGRTVLRESKGNWRGRKEKGGGVLLDLGSHAIDLAVYLLGAPSRVCGSVMQRIYSSEVEDLVSATLVFEGGVSATIKVNWSDESYRKPSNQLEILGTQGKILADRYGYKLFLREADPQRGFGKGWNHRAITDLAGPVRFYLRGNEFTMQMDHFVHCIEQGRTETLSSFREAFVTDRLMDDIRRDAAGELGGAGGQTFGLSARAGQAGPKGWVKSLFGKERQ
jgi:predicted dehydrogenase